MDHTDVGLKSVVRALQDVVAPAIDPSNSQANEQLRLSIDYIEFVIERLGFLHDRELFDLRHHLAMARAVDAIVGSLALPDGAVLKAAIEAGTQALAKPGARTRQLKRATANLTAAIAAIVRTAPALEKNVQRRIEQTVVGASHERIAFERSWYLPFGFDPDAAEVGALHDLINAAAPERGRSPQSTN